MILFQELFCIIKDQSSLSRWYQRKWFVKLVLCICFLFIWLITFEVGYWLYVIAKHMEKDSVILKLFVCDTED